MSTRLVPVACLLAATIALPGHAQEAPQPAGATPASGVAGRQVVVSEAAAAVLARSAAAYRSLTSYKDETNVERVFLFTAANGKSQRSLSRQSTRFAWAGPRAFTLRNEHHSIFCSNDTFTNLIPGGTDDKGRRRYDREMTKLSESGPIDWADAMGNIAASLCPTTVQSLLMTGPDASFDLFLTADQVSAGELDERPGVWVSGTGICPYTPAAGGGREVVPVKAWFSDKSGLIREIRFDISGTGWATSAAAGFGERNGSTANAAGSYVKVSIDRVTLNERFDPALFTPSDNIPSGGRLEFESIPGMMMGGKPPAAGMAPAAPAGMAPAKPMAAAKPVAAAEPAKSDVISPADEMRAALLGKPLPAFSTTSVDGTPVSLEHFKGKVVLLDFWATWCGPCMSAIPSIQRISERFKDQPVAVVGMNRDKASDHQKVVRTIERKGLTFFQAMDTDGTIAKQYKISAIPAMILVDRDGIVRKVHVGFSQNEEDVLAAEIDALLKQAPASQPK